MVNLNTKLSMIAGWLLLSLSASSQTKYTITGTLKGVKDTIDKVYINYRMGDENVRDSTPVKNGSYVFTGTRNEAGMVTLVAGHRRPRRTSRRDVAQLFMLGGDVNVLHTDSFSNSMVTGSKENAEYLALKEKLKPTDDEMQSKAEEYVAFRNNKDQEGMSRAEKEMEEIEKKQKEAYRQFFLANQRSSLALMVLQNIAGWDVDADEIAPLFNMLSADAKASPSGKALAEKIDIAKKLGIGKIAPDFTQNDTLGNPVALHSLRGKYLLVDFWASWCGPCRRENPNVVKAFNKYKDKGFHVLGVSLDQPNAKDKWMKAIHDDGLTWTHVSDLKYWNNAVAVQYGIQAIPQNYLLDPQGRIIAKNLSGEALDKKLSELLK